MTIFGHPLRFSVLFRCGLPLWLCLIALVAPAHAGEPEPPSLIAHLQVEARHLQPEYWIGLQADPDRVILDRAAIAEQNATMRRIDPSIRDIRRWPAADSASGDIRAAIESLSAAPARTLYDEQGQAISAEWLAYWRDNLALDAIPGAYSPRYGLVVQRADLRTFPTRMRVFSAPGDTDIDRFQESALFPGTPVAILHASRDGDWWFVASERYSAWIEQRRVALGDAAEVFRYADPSPPYLVMTGASVETVFTPERPALSKVRLDMGVRVPLLPNRQQPVDGQHPAAAYVIQLPERQADGTLRLVPALIPRSADVAPGYLPLTPRNLLRQSFKFLGERYGWGHAYDGRDCSGFVSEVYASFGVLLPRNTGDQAASPALNRIAFDASAPHMERLRAVRALRVGDLVYIPGHVMLVIGHADGSTWVIHDTASVTSLDEAGQPQRIPLNGVSVTALEPLRISATESYIDRITAIQRLRP